MATLSQGLIALLTSANCVDDKFREWLVTNEITATDSLGLLVSTETALEEKVFPMLQAAWVPITKMALMISIKKAWHLSRAQVDKEHATAAGKQPAPAADEPLSAPTRASITEAWGKKHGHTLSNDRLLHENLIGQLHREIHSKPPRLGIHLAESLRLQSSTTMPGRKYAAWNDQGQLTQEEHIADHVSSVLELFTRVRAFFNTLALASIHEPDWFSMQDAVFIEDKLLNMLQMTKEGRRPPVVFFTTAWASFLQHLSDELRTTGRPLSALIRETASWTPVWSSWSPHGSSSGPQADYSRLPALGGGPAKERELQAELDKTRKWASDMQSQRDRLANELKNKGGRDRSRDRGGGGGNANYRPDNGKGGKGGKGKGGKGGKNRR